MLLNYMGDQVLAVVSAYDGLEASKMNVYICGVEFLAKQHGELERIKLILPNGHQFSKDQLVTVHIDNRTGVSEYDVDLKVYRGSYKGRIALTTDHEVIVDPVEFQIFYGISIVEEYREQGYEFPVDNRDDIELPQTPVNDIASIDMDEHDNKIGILFTYAMNQPHSTVMAFLSTIDDDIFFITFKGTFKSQLLKRDNKCYFAIDSRASFTFEHAIEWNYSIIEGEVFEVPKSSVLFETVREKFIAKNPWEVGFFSHPDVEMYHLSPSHVVCPTKANI